MSIDIGNGGEKNGSVAPPTGDDPRRSLWDDLGWRHFSVVRRRGMTRDERRRSVRHDTVTETDCMVVHDVRCRAELLRRRDVLSTVHP